MKVDLMDWRWAKKSHKPFQKTWKSLEKSLKKERLNAKDAKKAIVEAKEAAAFARDISDNLENLAGFLDHVLKDAQGK